MTTTYTEKVREFYEALNNGDYKFIRELYHKDATYEDPIFSFTGKEIHALWYTSTRPEMKLKAECHSITENGNVVHTKWTFSYDLVAVKKRVVLEEEGTFIFEGDRVISHSDEYSFYDWATCAFGPIGRIIAWSKWMRSRVQKQARKSVLANLYAAQS